LLSADVGSDRCLAPLALCFLSHGAIVTLRHFSIAHLPFGNLVCHMQRTMMTAFPPPRLEHKDLEVNYGSESFELRLAVAEIEMEMSLLKIKLGKIRRRIPDHAKPALPSAPARSTHHVHASPEREGGAPRAFESVAPSPLREVSLSKRAQGKVCSMSSFPALPPEDFVEWTRSRSTFPSLPQGEDEPERLR
jgi:hypothetical protein